MPLQKFRSFAEARKALWCDKPDAAYYRQVAELWAFAERINPVRFPKGVFKFRSIEEANQAKERWLTEHVRQLREQRLASGTHRVVREFERR
jgi:hypothetical protein